MSTQPIPRLTVDQYLEIERKAEFKSEFIDGEVFTMSAAPLNHALIATALLARLFEQLRKSTCTVAGSDLRWRPLDHDAVIVLSAGAEGVDGLTNGVEALL